MDRPAPPACTYYLSGLVAPWRRVPQWLFTEGYHLDEQGRAVSRCGTKTADLPTERQLDRDSAIMAGLLFAALVLPAFFALMEA